MSVMTLCQRMGRQRPFSTGVLPQDRTPVPAIRRRLRSPRHHPEDVVNDRRSAPRLSPAVQENVEGAASCRCATQPHGGRATLLDQPTHFEVRDGAF